MKVAQKHRRCLAWLGIAAYALLAAAIAAPTALAHSDKKNGLEIVHPWTFATTDAGGTTRVFMKIKNLTSAPERLVGASTATAAKTELREPGGDGANAPSKPTAAVIVSPGKDAELTRSGPHLVLTGVKKRLDAYDSFKLTLVFEKAGRMVVDVMVEEAEVEETHKH
jgi:periplasmic copper chaperone A